MQQKINMGIDVGYGMLKIAILDANNKIKAKSWTSVVGSPNKIDFKPNVEALGKFKVSFNDKSFYVSTLAAQSKTKYNLLYKDWIRKDVFKALFLTGLGNGVASFFEDNNKKEYDLKLDLVTGLPVSYFKDREILKDLYSGIQEFTLGDDLYGNKKTFRLDINLTVVPQPYGTFYNVAFDQAGELRDDSLATDAVAIIDIGNYTTDLTVLREGDYIQHMSNSTQTGMAKVGKSVAEAISNKYDFDLESRGVEVLSSVLDSGMVRIFGKSVDVSDIVAVSKEEVSSKIISFVKENLGNGSDLAAIIVSGGGASLFFSIFEESFGHASLVPGDPSLANVVGYLKMSNDFFKEASEGKVVSQPKEIERSTSSISDKQYIQSVEDSASKSVIKIEP